MPSVKRWTMNELLAKVWMAAGYPGCEMALLHAYANICKWSNISYFYSTTRANFNVLLITIWAVKLQL